MLTKGQSCFYRPGNRNDCIVIRSRVETVHRDGSYSIIALFYLDANGEDRAGYLGFRYRVGADKVSSARDLVA